MPPWMLVVPAGLMVALLGGALALQPALERRAQVDRRLRALRAALRPRDALVAAPVRPHLVERLGAALMQTGLLSDETLESWRRMLSGANFRGDQALATFIGAKALLLVWLPALAFIACVVLGLRNLELLLPLAAAALGLLAPDAALRRARRRRQLAVERGLPDALDMLLICVEAGLGMDAGIERVAREIAPVHPILAEEFVLVATELRIRSPSSRPGRRACPSC